MKRETWIGIALLFLAAPLAALAAETAKIVKRTSMEVTVYNADLGVIKDRRELSLPKGVSDLVFPDVAEQIDATSVHYAASGSAVLEQNYQYDLVSRERLLQKYLGEELTVVRVNPENGKEIARVQGKLLAVEGGSVGVLAAADRLLLSPLGQVELPKLPGGLLVKPTLLLKIDNRSDKEKQVAEISYMTRGMTWKADYVAVVNAADSRLDLEGWVTVDNKSGAAYPGAKLKLVAGDINLLQPRPVYAMRMAKDNAVEFGAGAPPQFKESSLFEYHLYSLQRTSDIGHQETKQISFLSAPDVAIAKRFVYDPPNAELGDLENESGGPSKKVKVILEMQNSKSQGLGMPLPKGKVRVLKKDEAGQLQFLGEDLTDHVAEDEKLRLKIGEAFDVAASRTQVDFKRKEWCDWEKEIELSLRNRKKEEITVTALERFPLRGLNWKILSADAPYKKTDSHTAEFEVKLPAGAEKKIRYRAKTWCW